MTGSNSCKNMGMGQGLGLTLLFSLLPKHSGVWDTLHIPPLFVMPVTAPWGHSCHRASPAAQQSRSVCSSGSALATNQHEQRWSLLEQWTKKANIHLALKKRHLNCTEVFILDTEIAQATTNASWPSLHKSQLFPRFDTEQ